jgi:hypothetical protein
MKLNIIILLVLMLCSCASHQTKTGQRFYENGPSFYLSIAPSFSTPKEYEVVANHLVLRTYSGTGGYNWGRKREKLRRTLTTAQEQEIRELAVAAVKESIQEEQAGTEVIVMDGVGWYILTDYGQGPFLSVSTNNPTNSFYKLETYLEGLLQQK